ncbi:hypothetical protein FQA39_LY17904 [Lamprigera yunnana]|nr:hypothetical protein FQA39_LY17904 [Lamprigera yunnana]
MNTNHLKQKEISFKLAIRAGEKSVTYVHGIQPTNAKDNIAEIEETIEDIQNLLIYDDPSKAPSVNDCRRVKSRLIHLSNRLNLFPITDDNSSEMKEKFLSIQMLFEVLLLEEIIPQIKLRLAQLRGALAGEKSVTYVHGIQPTNAKDNIAEIEETIEDIQNLLIYDDPSKAPSVNDCRRVKSRLIHLSNRLNLFPITDDNSSEMKEKFLSIQMLFEVLLLEEIVQVALVKGKTPAYVKVESGLLTRKCAVDSGVVKYLINLCGVINSKFLIKISSGGVSDDDGGVVSDEDGGVVSDEDAGVVSDDDGGVVSAEDGGVVSDEDGGVVSDEDAGVVSDEDAGVVSDEDDGVVSAEDDGVVSDEDDGVVSAEDGGVVSAEDDGVVSAEDGGVVSDEDGGVVSAEDGGVVSDEEDGVVSGSSFSVSSASIVRFFLIMSHFSNLIFAGKDVLILSQRSNDSDEDLTECDDKSDRGNDDFQV